MRRGATGVPRHRHGQEAPNRVDAAKRAKQNQKRAMTKLLCGIENCIKIKGAEARGARKTPHPPRRHLTIKKT